jgi:hypothetical protein
MNKGPTDKPLKPPAPRIRVGRPDTPETPVLFPALKRFPSCFPLKTSTPFAGAVWVKLLPVTHQTRPP